MTYLPHGGPGQLQLQPLLTPGVDSIQSVVKALGLPQQNFPFTTEQNRAVETFTLQRLAAGTSQYTGFTITSAMASSNAQIFRVMPFVEATAIKFTHQYFDFHKELAVQTPAQAPPGYVEVSESETETTLNRYALGATTTVQELKTAKGQFIWRGKLIIVSIAFIETAELLAIQALLTTPSLYAQYFVQSGQHPIDLARAGRLRNEWWDILHTSENGMAELIDMIQQEFASQNIFANFAIVSEGMRSLIAASPKRQEYFRYGPGAAQNSARLTDAIGDVINEVEMIVVRPIELKRKDLRIAPLERLAVVGQHFRIDHFFSDCDLSRWCSLYMSTQVYAPQTDMYETIDIESALEADHRFDRADGRLSSFHQQIAQDPDNVASQRGVPVLVQDKTPQYDMFLYTQRNTAGRSETRVASLWGHMEEWALGHKAVSRTAETMTNLFKAVVGDRKIEAIKRGLEVITELYEKEPSAAEVATLQIAADINARNAAAARVAATTGRPVVLTGARPRYGVPVPPTTAELVAAGAVPPTNTVEFDDFLARPGSYRPYGYGSVAGLLTLSRVTDPLYDPALIADAIAFREAIVPVHQLFVRIFGISHPALDPNFAPSAFRVEGNTSADRTANSILNLFTNIFDVNKSSIFLRRDVDATSDPTLDAVAGGDIAFDPAAIPEELSGLAQAFATKGLPRSLAPYFSSADRVVAFEQAYARSDFARKFGRFLAEQNAARARTARGRRARGSAPTDVDQGETIASSVEGSGTTTLAQLHDYVVQIINARGGDAFDGLIAFYQRLAPFVAPYMPGGTSRTRVPAPDISNDLLMAWTTPGADFAAGGTPDAPIADIGQIGNYYQTPFVGSLNSVTRLGDTARLASPFDPSVPLDTARATERDRAAVDATGPNLDLLKMTSFSGQRNGLSAVRRPTGGMYGSDLGAQANSPFAGTRMPSFGSAEFQDVIGDELVTNRNIVDRFMHWGGVTDLLQRVCAQMFILAPITVHVLWAFKQLNIAQPVAWLVEQPFRRYRTTSAIFLSKPSDRPIGNIQWFDPDTHVGRNAINKNVMVHVSMYLGATVDDVHNWLIAYDIAVVGHSGGETTEPFMIENWKQLNINAMGREGPSLFYFMVPADSLSISQSDGTPAVHDIRGYSDSMHYAGSSVHRNSKYANRPYYKSALYYVALWGLDKLRTIQKDDWHVFHTYRDGTQNTVTAQGLQRVWDPHTENFDRVIWPQDVFGKYAYPGARVFRDSLVPRIHKASSCCDEQKAISF